MHMMVFSISAPHYYTAFSMRRHTIKLTSRHRTSGYDVDEIEFCWVNPMNSVSQYNNRQYICLEKNCQHPSIKGVDNRLLDVLRLADRAIYNIMIILVIFVSKTFCQLISLSTIIGRSSFSLASVPSSPRRRRSTTRSNRNRTYR